MKLIKSIKSIFSKKNAVPEQKESSGITPPPGLHQDEQTIAVAMGDLSILSEDASTMSYHKLNSKVARSIVTQLDGNMGPAQVAGIKAGLKAATEMFKVNAGIDVNDIYRSGKLLGAGAFAKVLAASHRTTGEKVAMKMIAKQDAVDLQHRTGTDPKTIHL
jgi:hypothetical protein